MQEAQISFSVQGYVRQSVSITDKSITPEKLQEMLNNGSACTTVQDNGEIIITSDMKTIGTVIDGIGRKSNLEYLDFEVYS